MRNSAGVLAAIRNNFRSLLSELRKVLGLDQSDPSPDLQVVVNRTLAGVVAVVAVVFLFLPGDRSTKSTVANALFTAANWLWHNKERSANAT